MKFFLFSFFISVFAFALNINVDYAKVNNMPYEILTIDNTFAFTCKKKNGEAVCVFNRIPTTPVFKTNTIYFDITPKFEKRKFIIYIKIKNNFILKSFQDNLYNKPLVNINPSYAKKWVIIAAKRIPFINNKNSGLNFYFVNSPKPYIGPIDENGNPLNINNQAADVVMFFKIQKFFKKGKNVMSLINDFIANYPDSVFIPDILYMKMKIYDKENKSEKVVSLGKKWIKNFAYNENLPKVLLLIAKNYTKLGFMSNASYFYQRIIDEYPNNKEAFLAMIYWGDQLYITGDSKKAFLLYKKALYSTKDINIASLAALRLAQRYMDKGDIKTAIKYYKKIYKANRQFVLKNKKQAYELAKTLASNNIYPLAIEIGEDLIKNLKQLDNLYEPLEYHLAVWSYEEGNYKKALYWINRYLKVFPYGDYSEQMSALRDKVLFEVPDNNLTLELNRINDVLKKYKGQPIAQKALYKKVIVLKKMKKYGEILKLSKQIMLLPDSLMKNKKEFLNEIKKTYALELIKDGKCFKLMDLIKKYNLTLPKKYDAKIYKCAMKTNSFETASVICNKYLDSPSDKIFIKWMKRKLAALNGMNDYKNIVLGVDDLCNVMKKGCYKYQLMKFFALWHLKEYKNALKVAKILEKYTNIKNTDAFIKIVNWALRNNDSLLAAAFAKKIIDLQNRFKAYPYSPFVDFTYAKYSKNRAEAVKVLKNLLHRIKGENLARAYFMLANLTDNKIYIDKCLNVKNSTLWKGLCKDAKSLF